MANLIEKAKERIYEKVFGVYDIFKNFFGENNVDLQNTATDDEMKSLLTRLGLDINNENVHLSNSDIKYLKDILGKPYIIVHWDSLTVTNEHDKSINIQDLFAKIIVNYDGVIPYEFHGFQLNRTTYPVEQIEDAYMFSHVPSIDFNNLSAFRNPCLGTGPLNQTILSLKNENNEYTWMLFCQELSVYVTVESVRGVPFRYLEQVGTGGNNSSRLNKVYSYVTLQDVSRSLHPYYNPPRYNEIIEDFILYYIEHGNLKIGYRDGAFTVLMPFVDYMVDVSNCFIDLYNAKYVNIYSKKDMFDDRLLWKAIIANNNIYSPNCLSRGYGYENHIGEHILTFKGVDYCLSVLGRNNINVNNNYTTLISYLLAMYVQSRILKIINYRFKNGNTTSEAGREASAAYENVLIL